jgi:uncharacterized protein YciI
MGRLVLSSRRRVLYRLLADRIRSQSNADTDARWIAMFVIELTYKADLQKIDAHMAAHVRFLKKYYASGNFLVSGRKIPRDGGIILAVGKRQDIDAIIKEDPFHEHGLADFRIIEFRASQRANDIQERIEAS